MTEVSCDVCAGVFTPDIVKERKADLEYQYFCCPYCNNPYLISVTDEELRDGIRKYLAVGKRIRKEGSRRELVDESSKLLHQNVRRSRELLSMYPMEVL